MAHAQFEDTDARLQTGIEGLDFLLDGGLPANRLHLIEGDPGTGKTTLALQFLLEGRRLGETCLYVTLSETTVELKGVAKSHGWSLDGLEMVELARPEMRTTDEQYTLYHPSEIELGEMVKSILEITDRLRPTRIVLDSLSEMRLLAQDPLRYRRQILALKEYFSGRDCTVLMLDDHTSADNDLQLQSIAHGVVLLEQAPFEYGRSRRRVRIVKLRGVAATEGYHDFKIARGGLVVFPQLKPERKAERRPGAISSGVPELDSLLGGGLTWGTTTLFIGPAGVGKSTLAAQYVTARDSGPAAVYLFDERRETFIERIGVIEALRNVTVIERPIRVAAVVSVVRAVLRARLRQYQMRDTLVALRAARSEAEAASQLKDEFLATLSHELRTPLNAILGWTTMLRHGQVDAAKVEKALEVVERNARAQAQLIEDVLDMARIITGNLRVELRPVALGPIVEAAADAARPGALAKGITLRTSIREVPVIRGDSGRLQQVLWNLLSNAVKFTPSGGDVSIALGLRGSGVFVTVSDTGAGLSSEFLPFIFDRFRQADQSVTRGHGGLGLGLSIVKHLVELHGGTVRAESAGPGHGATFRIGLPVPVLMDLPLDRPDAEAPARDAFALRFDDRRILVVDDDAPTRELLANVMERAGATVVVADGPAVALAQIDRTPPDLVIADIGMPDEDGYSLVRRIRALPGDVREVPVIALSAYTRAEDREAATEAGFTRFVAKPATPQHLLELVDGLLNGAKPVS